MTSLQPVPAGAADTDVPEEVPERRQPGVEVVCDLEGGEVLTVRVTNRERIHYEKTRAKHKEWPAPAEGQSFAMTFVTWSAAKRAGLTALTFDQWADVLLEWTADEVPADPTR